MIVWNGSIESVPKILLSTIATFLMKASLGVLIPKSLKSSSSVRNIPE